MHLQTVPHHRVRDFNMVKAVVLVALMGIGFCLTPAQHHDGIAADDDGAHSMVIPVTGAPGASQALPGVVI
ncbi:hypothetical protein [Salipiger aestuarii]|uniref:hypothetical protein n=1 Tax=Salipiger aestuarii TaxID=568098 RepID=UPI00025B7048|nr:hypothetical protein [Salipiger aestuarii]EIE48937.1 hypothetical protein C357_22295 [Citreicella sp. 357]KAA8616331.1 hypothetical protein AL037_00040 [Salipiger aestuarii]